MARARQPSQPIAKHPSGLRYTFRIVKIILSVALLLFTFGSSSAAEETSFKDVKVPSSKGKLVKGVLAFSDRDHAIEIHPAKGEPVIIPYTQIDKCSYEFTKRHRISEGSIATAPVGVGGVIMLTKSRSHWLEIDYQDQELPKIYVLRMDKGDYLKILDAVRDHTGKEAEILGNADKR